MATSKALGTILEPEDYQATIVLPSQQVQGAPSSMLALGSIPGSQQKQGGALGVVNTDTPSAPVSLPSGDDGGALGKILQMPSGRNVVEESPIDRQMDYVTQQMDAEKNRKHWGEPGSAHPGLLGKIAHGLSVAGNIAGDVLAPRMMALIPGTQLNRNLQQQGLLNEMSALEREKQEDAQTKNLDLQPELRQAQLGLAQEKQNETAENNRNKITANLREHGFKLDDQGNIAPLTYAEMPPMQQAAHDLKAAQEEQAEATAQLKKFQADPNSPQYRMAQQRIDVARQSAQTALAKLGLERENLQFREQQASDKQDQPTTQMRNMGEMAATVLPMIPKITNQIDSMASSLGPAVGRWNEFMVNKGGADHPEFANLDTNLDLLASAIVRTHFGARGGQEYRQELRKMFGEAQSPADLKARIAAAQQWIQGYAAAGKGSGNKREPSGNDTGGGRKAMMNGKQIEVRGGKWVYSDTGKAVE